MSTTRTVLPPRAAALPRPALDARLGAGLCVVALVGWLLHARVRDLGAGLWIDEAISLGIATHPLREVPGLLLQDGSPPLFYVLLHAWTSLFGASVRSAHALTLALAALAVPAAAWAPVRPFGLRAGVVAAAVVALSPFAQTYAIEVRMYSLLVLLGVLVCGTFLRAFVARAGDRRWAGAFAVALAAAAYTHDWGALLGLAAGLAWLGVVVAAPPGDRRSLVLAGLVGFGGAALLYLPWLPSALSQAAHTGAPWSTAPHPITLARGLERLLGGPLATAVLGLFAVAGLVGLVGRGTAAPVARRGVAVLATLLAGTLLLAFAWSHLGSPAWAMRYLAVLLGPLALLVGVGVARQGWMVAVVLAVVLLGAWYDVPSHATLAAKSDVPAMAARLGGQLPAGSVVFSSQPEQVPALAHELPAGLRYVTPLGAVPDVGVVDWRDGMRRLDAAAATGRFRAALAALRPGQRLLLVNPRFSDPGAPWTRRVRRLALDARRALRRAPGLRRVATYVPQRGATRSTVSAFLVERRP